MRSRNLGNPKPADIIHKKRVVYTRSLPRVSTNPAPRKPPPQHGLRIKMLQPGKGFTLKTAPWRIVVQDAYKAPRTGVVEQLGIYDTKPRWWRRPAPNLLDDGDLVFQKRLEWNAERLKYWIAKGARPTPRIVWLMQMTGISLDQREHQAFLEKDLQKRTKAPSPITEYTPDILVPNDPKQQERLKMRAYAKHYRNVTLEHGSDEWLEAQLSRPEMQADREFEAAQQEPYPLVPPALQKRMDLEPSRYARELPVWVARASQVQIDMRAAALGRPDISKPLVQPYLARLKRPVARPPPLAKRIPPLTEPPASELTRQNRVRRGKANTANSFFASEEAKL